jgi:acetyl-CoA C-acetyltransferase
VNTATETNTLKRVAIVGGVRIPFCRSNSAYSHLSNLDMLSDTLQSLVNKYGLDGRKIDEVIAGAVTTHSRDWNLTREAVLSTTLSPSTPGTTLQMACGTSLQAAMLIAGRIASGQIECGIAAGSDTTSDAPLVLKPKLTKRLLALSNARGIGKKFATFKGFSLAELTPQAPQNAEPRTGLSMGQHCELMAKEWGISRTDQDQLALASHLNASRAYDSGFFDDLVCDYQGVIRDNNIRSDSTLEKLASLAPAFDRTAMGTLTAGNSTSLTDGAAAVFLVSEEYAVKHDLPVAAWLSHCRTSAVDFVGGDGLLMAPTRAVSELLQRSNMSLQDFAFYEIHEAFAAQVLCTLKAWEDNAFCQSQLGLSGPLGSIERSKLNIHGSSLAMGHPFAATGARILSSLSKDLSIAGSGHGLISICTAGGMGAAAILSGPNS